MKALGIIRISTVRQEMEAQKVELVDFIKRDGFIDDDIIIIEGEGASAIKLDDYYIANMEKVKALVEKGGIKCVYAWHIDRIGRDEEFLMGFKKMLVSNKVNLKIKNPTLCLFNEDGTVNGGMELAFSLFATMAKQEMDTKKARFERTKKRNAEQGKYNGGFVQFGYMVDENGKIVECKEEADQVRLLYELYASGKYSYSTLAREMAERGYNGMVTERQQIHRLLHKPQYVGRKAENTSMPYTYPRIISDELFEKVAEISKGNNLVADKSTKRYYFATKLAVCPSCGYHLIGRANHYCCINANQNNGKCTDHQAIATEALDGLLFMVAAERHLLFLAQNSDLEAKRLEDELGIISEKRRALVANGDVVEQKIERAKTLFLKGLSTEQELDRTIAKIRKEDDERIAGIMAYDEKIRQIESQLHALENKSEYDGLLEQWDGVLDEESEKERQKIVRMHVSKVVVDKENERKMAAKIIEITLSNGEVLKFKYKPHEQKGQRLFRLVDGREEQYLEFYVKRAK